MHYRLLCFLAASNLLVSLAAGRCGGEAGGQGGELLSAPVDTNLSPDLLQHDERVDLPRVDDVGGEQPAARGHPDGRSDLDYSDLAADLVDVCPPSEFVCGADGNSYVCDDHGGGWGVAEVCLGSAVCFQGHCCTPDCDGKDCGSDVCGGECGVCLDWCVAEGESPVKATYLCQAGLCIEPCCPECGGNECGADGCGGACGICPPENECIDGQCYPGDCQPDCDGKECGLDSCGGTCGDCPEGTHCAAGHCVCDEWDPPMVLQEWLVTNHDGTWITQLLPVGDDFIAVGTTWDSEGASGSKIVFRFARYDDSPEPKWELLWGDASRSYIRAGFLVEDVVLAPGTCQTELPFSQWGCAARVSVNGELLETFNYSELGEATFWQGTSSSNGEVLVAGEVEVPGTVSGRITRLGSSGQLIGTVSAPPSDAFQRYYDVALLDNGVLLAVGTDILWGDRNILVVGLDQQGTQLVVDIVGSNGPREEAASVMATKDGGALVVGVGQSDLSIGNEVGLWIGKYDANLEKQWTHSYQTTTDEFLVDVALRSRETDYGFVVAGVTPSGGAGWADGRLVGLDHAGGALWEFSIGSAGYDQFLCMSALLDGSLLVGGSKNSAGPLAPAEGYGWIVKLSPPKCLSSPEE